MDDSAVRRTTHTADSVSDLAESMKRTQAAVPRSISTWGRIRRNPRVVVPGIILILIVIMAITAPWIIPHDPYEMNTRVRLAGPSTTNLLGTDEYGRDLLSRVILGSRTSLVISTTSVALATAFGLILGIFGGYLGGIWELISMRLVDALLTIPPNPPPGGDGTRHGRLRPLHRFSQIADGIGGVRRSSNRGIIHI
jgi:ABC-type dipeptide/oligopeptide/nickel transport system permease subunit